MEFQTEREAEFWERLACAVIVASRPVTVGDAPATVGEFCDNVVKNYRARRAKLDAPGAPYRDAK